MPMKIEMSEQDWKLICAYAKVAKGEIGGVAEVTPTESGTLRIHSPILPKQVATGGSVELDPVIIHEWLKLKFPDQIKRKMPHVNYCLWHSHCDMPTYFSSTDDAWVKEFVNHGALVSLVVNKKASYDIRVDTYVGGDTDETCQQITVSKQEIKFRIIPPTDCPIMARAKAEYKEKVTEPVVKITKPKTPTAVYKTFKTPYNTYHYRSSPPPFNPGSLGLGSRFSALCPPTPEPETIEVDGKSFMEDPLTGQVVQTTHKPKRNRTNPKSRVKKAKAVTKTDFSVTFREDGLIEIENDDSQLVTLHDTPQVEQMLCTKLNLTPEELMHWRGRFVTLHSDGTIDEHLKEDGDDDVVEAIDGDEVDYTYLGWAGGNHYDR